MTSGGMASFPGTLPLVSESMALLRPSSVVSVSSYVIIGRLSMVCCASSVIVCSVEYTSPDFFSVGQFSLSWLDQLPS